MQLYRVTCSVLNVWSFISTTMWSNLVCYVSKVGEELGMQLKDLFTLITYRFGLFEAMSAIEMMDPKMDAGMLCNKAKKVLQFEPAVKASRIIRIFNCCVGCCSPKLPLKKMTTLSRCYISDLFVFGLLGWPSEN